MTLQDYLSKLSIRYKSGISTEHSYRGDLQNLLETLIPDVMVTNEPTRIKCGAPDYIITKTGIPVGYVEAKDVGEDLANKNHKEQFDRYRSSLPNLITTNYLDFWLYNNGELVTKVSLGKIEGTKLIHNEHDFSLFTALIHDFSAWKGQTITSSRKLAEMMAAKARLLATIIDNVLINGEAEDEEAMIKKENITLFDQLKTFKDILIHDITHREFADIYAQTIAYGMFAARLHDPSLSDFSRQEAGNLIPKTNPFLRKLFQYIAGYDLDSRIVWIVDALADIFRATDVAALLKNFGSTTQQNDPIIHFYETFLSEYDPALRKARGVWYTPEPVVSFIIRAVDDILKTEFGLKQGLADNSKTKIKVKVPTKKTADRISKLKMVDEETVVHKVQILDPACGTGTFLAEIIKHLYKNFKSQQGIWSSYVEKDLLPRLNGCELLMASYAMAHLKLDLLLSETGFTPMKEQRFKIFLTNSLEEHHQDTGTLFASWLSDEANQANRVKRDTPVMVIVGNPPYSGISSNNGEWISTLIEDYKYLDGKHFGERKHWLQDDYVKFLRFSEEMINKNGNGVVAFINNHSFLSNPTFRGMRYHLLRSFDKIYIVDLHGNSKTEGKTPNGEPDKNVFDIQQGVSMNIFVKTGDKGENDLAKIFRTDVWGDRTVKYDFCRIKQLADIEFKTVKSSQPFYFFFDNDRDAENVYMSGLRIDEVFLVQSMGITSARDHFVIDVDKDRLVARMKDFVNSDHDDDTVRARYFGHKKAGKYLSGDTRGWTLKAARTKLKGVDHNAMIQSIAYRVFDNRFIYYSSTMVDWGREEVMKQMLYPNFALCAVRVGRDQQAHNYFITNLITDKSVTSSLDNANVFPLFSYQENPLHDSIDVIPNLDNKTLTEFAKSIHLVYKPELDVINNAIDITGEPTEVRPVDFFDYIYAVLYSPAYRDKYKDFLKVDFPRIPYPTGQSSFWLLARLGRQLRKIHLLESEKVEGDIASYPMSGDNILRKPSFMIDQKNHTGRVWLNETQYFDYVSEVAWNFSIGGYQPAQKWLKDRVGRTLSYDDILHYQKIIVALSETDRIMKEIEKIPLE